MNSGVYGDYDYGACGKKEQAAGKCSKEADDKGHYTDLGKLPYHPTFSNESKYSNAQTPGGSWDHNPKEGWVYTPSVDQMKVPEYAEGLGRYLSREYRRGIDNIKMPAPYQMPEGLAKVIVEKHIQGL